MSKLKLLLTGLAFAYKQLLVFMHTAHNIVKEASEHFGCKLNIWPRNIGETAWNQVNKIMTHTA